MNETQATGSSIRGLQGTARDIPRDPSIKDRLRECLGYISQLEDMQSVLRCHLQGPQPPSADDRNAKRADEPQLEEMLAMASQRLACLVSEAQSINARF